MRWLGHYVPVKHRYILTKNDRLRARYLALPVVACFVALIGFSGGLVTQAGTFAPLQTLAHDSREVFGPETKLAMSQKRLQRYGKEEDETLSVARQEYVPAPKPVLEPRELTMKIGSGDTLAGVLQKAGVGASEAYKAVMAMEEHYDPRKIRPGQALQVRFDPDIDDEYHFAAIRMDIDPIKSVNLTRKEEGGFDAALLEKEVVSKRYTGQANIEVSLYGSAEKAGIPASVIAQTMHIYSWDVDFQRDIRKGDAIEVMYDQLETKDGTKVKGGDVIYARLNINGQDIPVYRFETKDGDQDYFTAEGHSIRKALMQTPIDGARLSSGFGLRKHPVLGYNKMHKGIDFAASRGTPIYAAGDGTIEMAGPWSSYGNYVRIRHNASLKTAYAHMKGFAKGVSKGSRVKQGQVIGYVGTTGRSTGPHLHYEVLQNGRQVNPKAIKMPQGETLKGAELASFKKHVEKTDRQYVSLSKGATLASRQTKSETTLR